MPLIILGEGMINKNHVKFKGKMVGAVGTIHDHLKLRESKGELLLLTINEFLTFQVRVKGLYLMNFFS